MQKKALPRRESRKNASNAVGRSVSRPATPRDLWWVRWYGYFCDRVSILYVSKPIEELVLNGRTLKAALYGIAIGIFANMASSRFARGDLKARLCDISWIERKRFWFAVAPITYAVTRNCHDRIGVFRRR